MITFAHRGGSVETYGNTLAGITRSLAMGLDIEIDVLPCKDALICTHSNKLGSDMIAGFGLDGVRKYRLDGMGFELDVFPAEGGMADRIPTLLEVLRLAGNAPGDPSVLLDLKSAEIAEEVRSQVAWSDMKKNVLYGIHKLSELDDWRGCEENLLAFTGQDEFEGFCQSDAAWIRLWQDWITDEYGQLPTVTESHELLNLIPPHKMTCIMAGGPNHADGGVATLGQIRQLARLGADAIILNDPSLCLAAEYVTR
ncbi:MAG TPA: hypothetical protein VLE93_02475 [Candidatus Saccharimonadales bacterium]|nr:hypothetical protein [Candidatus Saccharimonadales bacterium]